MSVISTLDANLHVRLEHPLHINILEFIAIVINLWFVLWFIRQQHVPTPGGYCDHSG
jgi:hypothetical protein